MKRKQITTPALHPDGMLHGSCSRRHKGAVELSALTPPPPYVGGYDQPTVKMAARAFKFLALAPVVFSAFVARAHPGHEMFRHGIGHAVVSPDHLLVLGFAGGAMFGL